jgi:hypothetical protein
MLPSPTQDKGLAITRLTRLTWLNWGRDPSCYRLAADPPCHLRRPDPVSSHNNVAHMLRTQRRSQLSRTPPRSARTKTEAEPRNPLCEIPMSLVDLELKFRIESA